jgi:membrane carboxypeptidase/penicillin-binding protein PbpC
VVDWPEPEGISHLDVCDPSGQLPTRDCPNVVGEVFLSGREPIAGDTLYHTFSINRETGLLATVFTPPELVEDKTFLVFPAEARAWAKTTGQALPPDHYDAIQPPPPSPTVQISAPAMFAYLHGTVNVTGTAAGENFQSYQIQVGQGLYPRTWTQVGAEGTAPVTQGVLAEWNTQSLDGLYAVRLQTVRRDQSVEIATIQVTVDNTPPLVRIPYPASGQVFDLPQAREITFQAEASDAIGVWHVSWWVDGARVGESRGAPYAFTWRSTPGQHILEVQAEDQAGNTSHSEQIIFTVK